MTPALEIERLLLEAQNRSNDSQRADVGAFDRGTGIICCFDMEPLLRHARYVVSFNKVLDQYTSFDFRVSFIKNGCIHVGFEAKDFSVEEKNHVRRQLRVLLKSRNLREEYNISYFLVFGKHQYA